MDKQKLLDKAEAALLKNLDILATQDQPNQTEIAVQAVPRLVSAMLDIYRGLPDATPTGKPDPTALSGRAKDLNP